MDESIISDSNFSKSEIYKINLSYSSLDNCNFTDSNISYANMMDSFLESCNMKNSNLSNCNFNSCRLNKVSFYNANLISVDLLYARLYKCNLKKANYQISKILHSCYWEKLSNKLNLELMRRDAIICGSKKMNKWVNEGVCPFSNNIEQDFYFEPIANLWTPGEPKLNDMELFKELCKENHIEI
jgi:hypothetical protein